MKMKFINKKIVFAVTALFIVSLMPFIQSCSNNNELEGTEKTQSNVELTASEKTEIINSTEFEEFVSVNIELVSALRRVDSIAKDLKTSRQIKTQVLPNGVSYKVYPFDIDQNLQKAVSLKSAALQKKYPKFKNLNYGNIKDIMKDAIVKSTSIKEIFHLKGVFAI